MTDFPFAEVARKASILSSQGNLVCQKWSCRSCGRRVVRKEPNVFLPTGQCNRCGTITDIQTVGCNYQFLK